MNDRFKELALLARLSYVMTPDKPYIEDDLQKFAELIVKEMCSLMEQAEDDCYHCFEPSERPTDYIQFLYDWRTRFEEHFGIKE